MCGIMAFAALVALIGLKRGRQEVAPDADPATGFRRRGLSRRLGRSQQSAAASARCGGPRPNLAANRSARTPTAR